MAARTDTLLHGLRGTETARLLAEEASRPWSHEDNLWLRILKTPEAHLRPCDWAFLETRLGRSRQEMRCQLIKLGRSNFGRRYSVNETFFETWSRESAWVLGLLMSDGHLSRSRSMVHFSSIDRELVEKLCACMSATHTIYVSTGGVGHLGRNAREN